MLTFLLALLFIVITLLAVTMQKTYFLLPAKELKRRAERGDVVAANFWRAVGYGPSLRVFLWAVIVFSSALSFVLLASVAPPVLGFVAVAALLVVVFAWLPASDLHSTEARITDLLTPAVAWLVGALDPVLARVYHVTHRRPDGHVHTRVYVRDDLLDLIERQKSQADNELTIEELTIAASALQFGQKKVRTILIKRKKVVTVDAAADISPVFLDELHKTLHSRFPVYEGEPDNFIGTLYLSELTGVGSGKGVRGKVKTHMSPGIAYVHEADSLADVLHAFYLTKRQLFIVVNKFEEYVGIIAIEDVLRALLGNPGEYDFDQHDSRVSVAARHNKKPKVVDEDIIETAKDSTSPEEVVE